MGKPNTQEYCKPNTNTQYNRSGLVSTLQATEVEMSLFVVENMGRNVPPSNQVGIQLLDKNNECSHSGIQEDDWIVVTDSDLQKLLEDNEYTQYESYIMNNQKVQSKAMMNRYRFERFFL